MLYFSLFNNEAVQRTTSDFGSYNENSPLYERFWLVVRIVQRAVQRTTGVRSLYNEPYNEGWQNFTTGGSIFFENGKKIIHCVSRTGRISPRYVQKHVFRHNEICVYVLNGDVENWTGVVRCTTRCTTYKGTSSSLYNGISYNETVQRLYRC